MANIAIPYAPPGALDARLTRGPRLVASVLAAYVAIVVAVALLAAASAAPTVASPAGGAASVGAAVQTAAATNATLPSAFVSLPSPPATEREAGLLAAMNRERATFGVQPLQAVGDLVLVARRRSDDMMATGEVAHYSPRFSSAAPLVAARRPDLTAIAENIVTSLGPPADSVELAITALMRSPSHRAAILSGGHRYVGVGEATDEYGISIYTTVFAR